MLVQIPFDGFYESAISMAIDDALEFFIEDAILADKENEGLTTDDLEWTVNYEAIAESCMKYFIDGLFYRIKEDHGVEIPIKAEFKELISPREYNFETDKIIADIPVETMQALFNLCDKNEFEKLVKREYTSRSGFISFHSNDYRDWGELEDWATHQAGCILETLYPEFLGEFAEYMYDDTIAETIYNNIDIKIAE